jgi:hypothetical protein
MNMFCNTVQLGVAIQARFGPKQYATFVIAEHNRHEQIEETEGAHSTP